MKLKNRVFLDLEATIIPSWSQLEYVWHNARLKDWLAKEAGGEVSIFSFAVDHAQDVAEFNLICRPEIERIYDVKVVSCPSGTDFLKTVIIQLELYEFKMMFGKKLGFIKYIESLKDKKGINFVLIDDAVDNCVMTYDDYQITLISIDTFKNNSNSSSEE